MLAVLLLIYLLLVFGYAVFWRQSRTRQCFAHLPTFPQLPLIGSAHYLLGGGRQLYLRIIELSQISERSQLPFVIWMGSNPALILTDLDDITCVTNEFIEKPYYYSFAQDWLGDGIVIASADKWKRNIKKIAGTFRASTVETFQKVFNSQARKLVRSLKTEVGRGPFNVLDKYLAETTLEAICQIALGVPKITDRIVTTEYHATFTRVLEIIYIRSFNVLLHSDLIFGLTSYKKEMLKAVDKLNDVCETVLKIRLQGEDNKGDNDERHKNTENSTNNIQSYLDILLQLNAKDPTFTMKQVRDEINTIILGGQETVSTSLFYILLMIGCHAEVQEKLHTEMKNIFGDSDREVEKDDLARMTYCEAVICETLRLYPPILAVLRVSDHELKLKSCTVPKDVHCVINISGVGRSKKYWGSDAEEFRPERFESSTIPTMIPFSTGRRACIGKKYAMSILKTIVAYCVRDLVFTAQADKIQPKIDISLRSVCMELLQVKLRQK